MRKRPGEGAEGGEEEARGMGGGYEGEAGGSGQVKWDLGTRRRPKKPGGWEVGMRERPGGVDR